MFTKIMINPMIGAAGISAFPMTARVLQKMGLKEDPTNHLLMHAIGANVSGQIAYVLAGGMILYLIPKLLARGQAPRSPGESGARLSASGQFEGATAL